MMKVLEFLQNAKVFYVATTDGEGAHVRPIGFVMDYEGKLAFYTDKRKDMYKQMCEHPKIELCAIDGKMNTLRLKGEAKFITSKESKKAALEALPMLKKAGYTEDDDVFEIYTIDNATVSLKTMMGKELDIEL